MQLNDTVNLNGLKQDLYFKGKFNSGTFNQSDLNRIINKYYKLTQKDIREVNEDFYLVATKADLSSGTNVQYSFPVDYEKVKRVYLAMSPASTSAPLRSEYQAANIAYADQINNPSYLIQDPTIVVYGDYFEVPNTINSTVTGGIRMLYIPYQTDLVNDTDVPNIMLDYHDVITWGALIDIAPRLNNDELLQRAMQLYEQRRNDMKASVSNRVSDTAEYIEGQSPDGGWDFPFGKPLIL